MAKTVYFHVPGIGKTSKPEMGGGPISEDRGEKGIVEKVYKLYTDHPYQGDRHQTWAMNKAFYKGNQRVDTTSPSLLELAYDEVARKRHINLNFLVVMTQTAVNKLISTNPLVVGTALTDDRVSQNAAEYVSDYLEYAFFNPHWGMRKKQFSVLENAFLFDIGFMDFRWDKTIRRPMYKKEKNGRVRRVGTENGDFVVDIRDGFTCYPDPYAKDYESIRYATTIDMVPVEKAREAYPGYGEKIQPYTHDVYSEREQFNPVYSPPRPDDSACLVARYVSRPDQDNPKGLEIVTINNELLVYWGNNPIHEAGQYGAMPIVPYIWDREPDKLEGKGPMTDVIGSQEMVNDIATLIFGNLHSTSLPTQLIPDGMDIRPVPGMENAFYYKGVGQHGPIQWNAAGLNPQAYNLLNTLTGYMETRMGVTDVSKGKIGRGMSQISARALAFLENQSLTQHNHVLTDFTNSIVLSCWVALNIMRKNYSNDRMLSFVGADGKRKLRNFNETFVDADIDIQMKTGNLLDREPAAKAEWTMNAWTAGLYQALYSPDPSARKAARKALTDISLGDVNSSMVHDDLLKDRAQEFIEKVTDDPKNAEIPDLYASDDPYSFLEYLQNYMNKAEFFELEPIQQQALDAAYRYFDQVTKEKWQQYQTDAMPPQANQPQAQDMAEGQPPAMSAESAGPGPPIQ